MKIYTQQEVRQAVIDQVKTEDPAKWDTCSSGHIIVYTPYWHWSDGTYRDEEEP